MTSVLILLLIGAPDRCPLPAPPPELVVRAGHLHTGTGKVLEGATLEVRGGRIVAVRPGLLPAPEGAAVLDLGDLWVMPGMVDGLSHAGLPRGSSENEEGREHTPALRVVQALDVTDPDLARLRRRGVTSLAVQPGGRNVTGGLVGWIKPRGRSAAEAVVREAVALRITLGRDPAAGHRQRRSRRRAAHGLLERRPRSGMGTVWEVRRVLHRARVYAGHRRADAGVAADPGLDVFVRVLEGTLPVHWLARSENAVRAALRIADEYAIPHSVVLEGHEADLAARELAAGNVAVLYGPPVPGPATRRGRGRHAGVRGPAAGPDAPHEHRPVCLVGCTEDHRHTVCNEPTHVHDATWPTCHGPGCCAPGLSPAPPDPGRRRGFAVPRLLAAGVRVGLARGGYEAGRTLLDGARFAVRRGLSASRAIAAVTLKPARILGIDDRVGSLEPGKDADLVALDGDPLAPTSAVRLVMVDGRIVHDARPAARDPVREASGAVGCR